MRLLKVTLCISILSSSLLFGAVKPSNAKFLKPAEAIAQMDMPEGIEVKTFVAEPDIAETIAFCFDDKGRLWTLDNKNYTTRRSHITEKGLNRIQIFEDTDGDGVFDKKKTFLDNLSFSSGITVGHGGVYLGKPPELLFYADANGDDKPDGEPEVLLDGWGMHDRHETLNSFTWGPDGWMYGCHGVFTRSLVGKPGTPKDQRQFIDGGIWRFHPVKKEFEIFTQGLSNPWGFDFNHVGEGFATCCVIPHLFHIVQGGSYDKQGKKYLNPYLYEKIMTCRDHTHKSAHGGAKFYLAKAFPKRYWGQLFMCNIHEHAVLTDIMVPNGSGYIGQHGEDFIKTHDQAFVGFSVQIGPEGAVYILDWHDQDICGNSVRFPNSSRVYRILPKGMKGKTNFNLRNKTDLELVQLQLHDNDWYVRRARTILHERASKNQLDKTSVYPALFNILKNTPTIEKKLRAFWSLHVIGALKENNSSALVKTLQHKEEMIRAWSIQLLCEDKNPSEKFIKLFEAMSYKDSSPKVRLYLASALQRIPFDQRWAILEGLATHQEDASDHNIPKLVWQALEPMVMAHPEKSLKLSINSKSPTLQQFVSRRLLANVGNTKKKQSGHFKKYFNNIAGDFKVINNSLSESHSFMSNFRNKPVIMTQTKNTKRPSGLYKEFKVSDNKETKLRLKVSHRPHAEWNLKVLANDDIIYDNIVSSSLVHNEWLNKDFDLSDYAGQNIKLRIENHSTDELSYIGMARVFTK